jgi:hypothetical protein
VVTLAAFRRSDAGTLFSEPRSNDSVSRVYSATNTSFVPDQMYVIEGIRRGLGNSIDMRCAQGQCSGRTLPSLHRTPSNMRQSVRRSAMRLSIESHTASKVYRSKSLVIGHLQPGPRSTSAVVMLAVYEPAGSVRRLPGLLIRFIGSILRTATMTCHLPAHRRRSALQTFGYITNRRPKSDSSRNVLSLSVSASSERRRTAGTIPPCCDNRQ